MSMSIQQDRYGIVTAGSMSDHGDVTMKMIVKDRGDIAMSTNMIGHVSVMKSMSMKDREGVGMIIEMRVRGGVVMRAHGGLGMSTEMRVHEGVEMSIERRVHGGVAMDIGMRARERDEGLAFVRPRTRRWIQQERSKILDCLKQKMISKLASQEDQTLRPKETQTTIYNSSCLI